MTIGAVTFTDAGNLALRKGTILPESDTIVAILVNNAHTPSVINDDVYSDVSANECADGDYAAQVVANLLWSQVSSRNFKLDADDIDFGNTVSIASRYIYLVKRAGGSLVAGDLILGFIDLNTGGSTNVSSTAGNFDYACPAAGLFTETLTP